MIELAEVTFFELVFDLDHRDMPAIFEDQVVLLLLPRVAALGFGVNLVKVNAPHGLVGTQTVEEKFFGGVAQVFTDSTHLLGEAVDACPDAIVSLLIGFSDE